MNNDDFVPHYDESKEIEIIFDFHNTQIWRINTTNADVFLKSGFEYDKGILARLDEKKRCRMIYVADQVAPLTAILRHIESPFEIDWAVMAIIVNEKQGPFVEKISPIISYGLGITQFKKKFVVGVFKYRHRNNLKEVIEWMDKQMDMVPRDTPVEWFD